MGAVDAERDRRFGEARVTWKTFPVLPGEPLEATIRTRRPFRVQGPVPTREHEIQKEDETVRVRERGREGGSR